MRREIEAEGRRWIGVPWRHQGRSEHGIDCAGLVVMVGRCLGLTDYDNTCYGRRPDSLKFVEHFLRGGAVQKSVGDALPGDILIFRQNIYPCHCGLLTERAGVPMLLHAYAPRRKVVEEFFDDTWASRQIACFSYAGVE